MVVMVLFGMGMGFMMQPLMLAIQAAADRRHGHRDRLRDLHAPDRRHARTAVFLSILFSLLPDKIATRMGQAQGRPTSARPSPTRPTRVSSSS